MKKKVLFWLICIPVFGDLLFGGVLFALSGDYWQYQPLPINAIESTGFTAGFSLLLLLPYLLALYLYKKNITDLGPTYKKIFLLLFLSVVSLYAVGFIHLMVNQVGYKRITAEYQSKQQMVENQLQEDVKIESLRIEPVPKNYQLYKVMFRVVVPAQYIGNAEGLLELETISYNTFYDLKSSISYKDWKIVQLVSDSSAQDFSTVDASFNSSGDVILDVTSVLNEIDNPNKHSYKLDLLMHIMPTMGSAKAQDYYELEYRKTLEPTL